MLLSRATITSLVVATVTLALAAPAYAALAEEQDECAAIESLKQRTECQARATARAEAKAEVERSIKSTDSSSRLNDEWQAAMREARSYDYSRLVSTRLLAAVGGTIWFLWLVRRRLPRRRRKDQSMSSS